MSEDRPYVVIDDYFINWRESVPIVHFPYHVQEILYELALNYLITKPSDPLEYCLQFFVELKKSKQIDIDYDYSSFKLPAVAARRRNSVFAKSFDLDELAEVDGNETDYPKSEEERNRLKTTIRNVLFFKNLEERDLNLVVNAMFLKHVRKGETIIQQGDDGDYFYVIQKGIFNAFKNKEDGITDLCHYANSGSFGELALLYNQPRAASVVATTDGLLWVLDRETFQRIVLGSSLKRSQRFEKMIENVPLLMALNPMERRKVADALVLKQFDDGYEIVKQGDDADGMYFVESGTVVILRKEKDKEDVLIKRLLPGEYFGELALIAKKPRACSVVADGVVKVVFLEVEAFERLLGPCKKIMERNVELYDQQLAMVLGSKQNLAGLL